MNRDDAIRHLRRLADQAEATGIEQYRRSTQGGGLAHSDFGNALHWGRKAREYRQAAFALEAIKREQTLSTYARTFMAQCVQQLYSWTERAS